ncbi:tRNA-uridine aminocarboxypropyltransferase 2-like [Sycon ciliatum]|uniref:tRNA-uridine aminocarboxypropyltransferase 2-like n=1 Tax=Sycon ciliatum TaxID=27933 RepID=UPI0031F5F2D7
MASSETCCEGSDGATRLHPVLLNDFGDFSDELTEPLEERRVVCRRCIRPQTVCICAHLPEKRHRCDTKVLVLQHPREEIRGLRTVPILEACLAEGCVKVVRSKRFPVGRFEAVDLALQQPDTLVLYPAKQAIDISLAAAPTSPPRTLIVLDGTWKQAKGLYVQNERLRNIPAVSLSSTQTSAYIIRTQPTDTALSTLESAALALSILENKPQLFEDLVRPLRALCNIQLEHGAQIHHSKEALARMREEQEQQQQLQEQQQASNGATPHSSNSSSSSYDVGGDGDSDEASTNSDDNR